MVKIMMKKLTVIIFTILTLIAISACSHSEGTAGHEVTGEYELNDTITQLNAHIEELMAEIDDLQNSAALYRTEISRLDRQIHNLTRELEEEPAFINGMTREQVLESLIENSESIATEIDKLIGLSIGDSFLASVRYYKEHIVIRDSDVLVNHGVIMPVLLFYHVERVPIIDGTVVTDFEAVNWDMAEWISSIKWTVAAYGDTWDVSHMRIVQPPANRRHLTDLETVSLHFYDWNQEPPIGYQIEEISGIYLWEESIRLAQHHYGLQIRDLWFDGGILYIDFFPAVGRFNTGLGSIINTQYFRQTFSEFPHADELRLLVGGERPGAVGYNGFDINCIYPCPVWRTWGAGSPYACICTW